jgi:hypothetical protein
MSKHGFEFSLRSVQQLDAARAAALTPEVVEATYELWERTVRSGISGTMMPSFTQLSDHDLTAVLAYVRSFSNRWKDPTKHHDAVPLPEVPEWFNDAAAHKAKASAAAPLFQASSKASIVFSGAFAEKPR